MREYGFSALTSVISERSGSSSRIARIAFIPAVPPPMIRCRAAIIRSSEELASSEPPSRLALRGSREHALEALGRKIPEPVLRGDVLVENRRRGAGLGARRSAAAEVALEGLAGGRIVEHRPVRAGDRAELAAHAQIVDDVLGPRRVDGDRAHRAGRHAPALGALVHVY